MSDHEDYDLDWGRTEGVFQTEGSLPGTYRMQCSDLAKGRFVMLEGRPCKIVELTTSDGGKHGSPKVHLEGLDIFTGKKYEGTCRTSGEIDAPEVQRKEYQLIDINEAGFLSLMDDSGETREDIQLPEGDLGKDITARNGDGKDHLVAVLKACGEEMAVATKTMGRE